MIENDDDESIKCELLSGCSNNNNNKKVIVKDLNVRKQNARNRWKILASAILSNSKRDGQHGVYSKKRLTASPINVISNKCITQDFDGFDLVTIEQLKKDDMNNFSIKIDIGSGCYECNVHLEKLWSVKDLIGFNNTGNIKFWSSEAALCHYVLENINLFDSNSWVIELGGGMFCLAALMIAKYSSAFLVHLTDGNETCLQNIKKSVMLNDFDCFLKSSGTYCIHVIYILKAPQLTPTMSCKLTDCVLFSSQMGRISEAMSIRETKISFHLVCRLFIFR
jgi:hypothetical protein